MRTYTTVRNYSSLKKNDDEIDDVFKCLNKKATPPKLIGRKICEREDELKLDQKIDHLKNGRPCTKLNKKEY